MAEVWAVAADEASPDLKELDLALRTDNTALYGDPQRSVFGITVRENGKLSGGARGVVHWKWFYLSHLWVQESFRGQGLGARLVAKVLEEARRQNLAGVYVDTFSSDAVRFYKKAGFQVVGTIPRFVNGFDRTYLKISLAEQDPSR